MLIATLVPYSTMVNAESQKVQKAETFLALALKTKEKVEDLIQMVEDQPDAEVPEDALTYYGTGSERYDQALEAFALEDYEGSIELSRESLWYNREAIKVLNGVLEPLEAGAQADNEESDLGEAIERARDRIARVLAIIDAMLEDYPDLDATLIMSGLRDTLLLEAEGHLADAETLLGSGDVPGAAHELGEANRTTSGVQVFLKRHVNGALNSGRVNGFSTVMENFHDRLERQVERRIEEGPLKEQLKEDLAAAIQLIGEAKESADFTEQVRKLMEARILLESVQEALKE
jgi:tetratricopeptide (TPR) repeat protein